MKILNRFSDVTSDLQIEWIRRDSGDGSKRCSVTLNYFNIIAYRQKAKTTLSDGQRQKNSPNFQLGSRDLGVCFWLIYKCLPKFSTHIKMCFWVYVSKDLKTDTQWNSFS